MPINRNAFLRYQVLDRCFSNFGRMHFFDDLIEEINEALEENNGPGSKIGRTQLFKDIAFMESEAGFSIPLEKHKFGRKVYYRYSKKDFTIRGKELSSGEIEIINTALQVFLRFKGLPQFEWVDELVPVLQDKLGMVQNQDSVILFDTNEDYSGLKHIHRLFQAISNKVVLKVEYHPFVDASSSVHLISPQILKQYNNRWFLFGHNHNNQDPYMTLALDRIIDIQDTDEQYFKMEVDWDDDVFYDIVGVSRGFASKAVDIQLKVYGTLVNYIRTKPIHLSQKSLKQTDGGFSTSIKVVPNRELYARLLSFGSELEVSAPKKIREGFQKVVREMASRYAE